MGKNRADGGGRRSDCPIACVLDIVGDKWTLLVIRDLALGRRHFEEFLHSPERIATNILSARLRQLEEAGYLTKETDPDDRRKSVYQLTDQGQQLLGLLRYIARWGLKHIPDTRLMEEAKQVARRKK